MLFVLSAAAAAPVVFEHATVHPVSSAVLEDGVVVVADGHIVAVGPSGSVAIPDGATRVDLTGKHLIPGLVDTHSHIGATFGDLNEATGPLQPGVSSIDAIDVTLPSVELVRAGGIT